MPTINYEFKTVINRREVYVDCDISADVEIETKVSGSFDNYDFKKVVECNVYNYSISRITLWELIGLGYEEITDYDEDNINKQIQERIRFDATIENELIEKA